MKTIYKSFIAFAAALLLVPVAHAQRDIPYVDKDSFGYNKYVVNDNPNSKGEYTLRIETFLTGTVETKQVAVPSDIILVLDASGSMNECYNIGMRVPEDLELAGTATVTFNAFDTEGVSTNGWRWIRFPYDTGDYYRIHRVRERIGTDAANKPLYSYYYYFDVESGGTSTRYYLNLPTGTASAANPGFTTEKPDFHDETTSTDGAAKQMWRGKVYRYPLKVKVMREAVSDFIDEIARNNDQLTLAAGETGNRIAVVRFATSYPTTAAFNADSLVEMNTGAKTSVLKKFYEVSAVAESTGATNATALKTAVNNMTISGNTSVDQGFNLARLLMKDADADYPAVENGVTKRNRVVVLFTDGEPNGDGGFKGAVQRTINISNLLKASSEDAEGGAQAYDTKVFTIGVWPSATASTKTKWDMYMGHVSSNYPIAGYITSGNMTTAASYLDDEYPPLPEDKRIYYMDSSQPDFDLKKVFMAIAQSVGGENKGVGESSIMLDKISDSFELPADIDASKIKVYTAQCLGELDETYIDPDGAEKHYLAFADPVEAGARQDPYDMLDSLWVNVAKPDKNGKQPFAEGWIPTYQWEKKLNYSVDGNISFEFNTTSQQVTVTGFNYADLWCGHDPAHQSAELYDKTAYEHYQQGFRGFKLILEFPIVAKDGALGGMNVPTNKPESGLYLPNAQGAPTTELLRYQEPALPIPVNLWIEKRGLRPNESATINIYRKLVSKPEGSTVEPEYNFFQRVNFIGKEDGSPVLEKLLNLDPRYFYKVWEEGWSWSYTNQAADFESAPSTETVTENPIVVKNDYDDPDVKHAEAAKRNKMERTGGN